MAKPFPDQTLANLSLIEELYARYLADPSSVDPSWLHFFEGMDFGSYLQKRETPSGAPFDMRIYELIQAYRRLGHLLVPINPIALTKREAPELAIEAFGFSKEDLQKPFPALGICRTPEAPLSEIVDTLSKIYCSRIGFEYLSVEDKELRQWIQEQIEPDLKIEPAIEEKRLILDALNRSELLEKYLHTKYAGQKRFSLEGVETIIPLLAELIEEGISKGIEEFFLGMAHRGRLNVLSNILGKPYSVIFKEFEDTFYPLSMEDGSGDVKYHKGFSSEISGRVKKNAMIHLAPNASHLESVDAIILGQAKASQVQKGGGFDKAIPILLHGDAAFAGQGVVYETMQLASLDGYETGGTIHIILNNQIGFTTQPEEAHSMRYCSDLAKAFGAPVFHLNAEDPESCIYAAKMAMQIRQRFGADVILDLNGYRKYGHNEGDEPSFTQPLHYKLIRSKTPIRELYLQKLLSEGHLEKEMAEALEGEFKANLEKEQAIAKDGAPAAEETKNGFSFEQAATAVDEAALRLVVSQIAKLPSGFHLHPKLAKWIGERGQMLDQNQIDWGLGECLAMGTLLLEKTHVRLSGQDVRRGTFSHRHAVLIDQENGERYFPLAHLSEDQGQFYAYNSPLSEYAVLGFEFGYSWNYSNALIFWEAQFGDFANTAQVVIDQYIASAEQKWMRTSSLVLLLPHGMEGQGPEHSSARIERFLQLSSNNNMQIVNATSSAQLFHALRRQIKRENKKPLVVFTPKSHLRSKETCSPLNAFTRGSFQEILDDPQSPLKAARLLFCSGKVFFDLEKERQKRGREDVALIRIEQLYPLHREKIKEVLGKYGKEAALFWVQEEHENMGAWEYIRPELEQISGKRISYAGRRRSSSPATGSHRRHEKELHDFLEEAFK